MSADIYAGKHARIAELEAALRDLSRAYVNLLEIGRDRIVSYGGKCDPVDVMEAGDPALRAVRIVLAKGRPSSREVPMQSENGGGDGE